MDIDEFDDFKIILWLILFLLFGIIIITCKPKSDSYVMTVNGQEAPGKMGTTLEHEHILVDFIGADSTGYFRWNRDSVIARAKPFVIAAKNKGVRTIIECTPSYLGRDPLLLKELSRQTGVNFITNTGYYGANNNKHIPRSFYGQTAEEISSIWINEFRNGIENTGIRPGFIKIAVNPSDTLSPEHRKIITAAGIAHLATGLVIASHTGPDKPAFEQIKVLKEHGVSPSAFIWVHAQSGTVEGNISAAREGAWISLDNISNRPDVKPDDRGSMEWYAGRISALKEQGLLNRVLLSHDSGWYDPSQPGGGQFNGYTDIFDYFIPVLKSKGFTNDDIDRILIKNPAEAFTVNIRKYKPN
jgi:phosphotriesterase-related protein